MREYKSENKEIIVTTTIETPIGEMFAAASKKGIVMLCFFSKYNIEAKIDTLKNNFNTDIIPSNCEYFDTLRLQLDEYFNKQRECFDIPMQLLGSSFQIKVWKQILEIPYGKTISYKEQALKNKDTNSSKAVANANAQNMLQIIVPCHRVIGNDDKISTHSNNIKKEFLLNLEKKRTNESNSTSN